MRNLTKVSAFPVAISAFATPVAKRVSLAAAILAVFSGSSAQAQLAPEAPSVAGKVELWSCDFLSSPRGEKQNIRVANRTLSILDPSGAPIAIYALAINNDEAIVAVSGTSHIRPSPGFPADKIPYAESDTVIINRLDGDAAEGFTGLYKDGMTYRGKCQLTSTSTQK